MDVEDVWTVLVFLWIIGSVIFSVIKKANKAKKRRAAAQNYTQQQQQQPAPTPSHQTHGPASQPAGGSSSSGGAIDLDFLKDTLANLGIDVDQQEEDEEDWDEEEDEEEYEDHAHPNHDPHPRRLGAASYEVPELQPSYAAPEVDDEYQAVGEQLPETFLRADADDFWDQSQTTQNKGELFRDAMIVQTILSPSKTSQNKA